MSGKTAFLALWLIFPLRIGFSQIVVSEVMFDPIGPEYSDEFVELYNMSSTDTIDLKGWRLGDGTEDDALIDAGMGFSLPPNQYALVLDPDYFGNSTSYDSLIPPKTLILTVGGSTIGSGGLSNTKSETVSVYDKQERIVDRYSYHTGNRPGYSDERIDLNESGGSDNWADSKVIYGTPGRRNSMARVPLDLNLGRLFVNISPGSASLNAVVLNDGTMIVSDFSLRFYEDANMDSVLDEKETIGNVACVQSLSPGDSAIISIHPEFRAGVHRIAARVFLEDDEKPEDDVLYSRIVIGFPENSLIINEIMYNPLAGDGEWIELLNVQPDDVDLAGWSISDSDSTHRVELCPASRALTAGGFLIIAGDSSLLVRHPGLSAEILVIPQLPSLNNDSDTVNLYDPSGNRVDRMGYSGIRGGRKGVSLERIDPHPNPNAMDNWHFCISPSGGTPGESNSVSSISRITEGTMEIQPNPFSPDGDGWEEAVGISFNLPFDKACIQLRIFDICGRIIKRIERGGQTGKTGRFVWDGLDDQDESVPIGRYIVLLEASEQDGGRVFRCRSVLILARRL